MGTGELDDAFHVGSELTRLCRLFDQIAMAYVEDIGDLSLVNNQKWCCYASCLEDPDPGKAVGEDGSCSCDHPEREVCPAVPPGLSRMSNAIEVPTTVLTEGSVVLTIPVIVLFHAAEGFLTEGLTSGADKSGTGRGPDGIAPEHRRTPAGTDPYRTGGHQG